MYRCPSDECFSKCHTVYSENWVKGINPSPNCHCGLTRIELNSEQSSRPKHVIKGDISGTSQTHYSL